MAKKKRQRISYGIRLSLVLARALLMSEQCCLWQVHQADIDSVSMALHSIRTDPYCTSPAADTTRARTEMNLDTPVAEMALFAAGT